METRMMNRNEDAVSGVNDVDLYEKLVHTLGKDSTQYEFVRSCKGAIDEHGRMSKRQYAIAHNVIRNHVKSKKMLDVIGVMYGVESITYKKTLERYQKYGAFLSEQAKYVIDKIMDWTDGVDKNVDKWFSYEKLNTIKPFNKGAGETEE